MKTFAELCERVGHTTKKTTKVALVADYFRSQESLPQGVSEAATAAIFLSGRAFPAFAEEVLNVGEALLSRVLVEVAGATNSELSSAYRKHGDLGAAAFDIFSLKRGRAGAANAITLLDVESAFKRMAQASGAAKSAIVRDLLQRSSPLEAKYLIKIMTGDLRIGLRESLVEEAIAKAYDAPYPDVRRANMLLGDISAALRLAAEHRLNEAKMRLFHPVGLMLASPVDSAEEAFRYFTEAEIEDKYDGIRAQVHANGSTVRIFSRTRDEITSAFPELQAALLAIGEEVILDGEILAWERESGEQPGRALPFSTLQQRIGRKSVDLDLLRAVPVAYMAFDVIYANGELVIDGSLQERKKILQEIFARFVPAKGGRFQLSVSAEHTNAKKTSRQRVPGAGQGNLFAAPGSSPTSTPHDGDVPLPPVLLAQAWRAATAEEISQLFDQAQERGNEGLMIKDLSSPYTPGRRGKTWLKLKRELATLDVVVTAAEYGHGKRAAVLSDYTFAVLDGERLVNVGKAYSGLTDVEISEMTKWFLDHTVEDLGHMRTVEPKVVLEVAFNNVMKSDRHESGYALRFPRIVRIRDSHEKSAKDIDTVERVQEIFEKQGRKA